LLKFSNLRFAREYASRRKQVIGMRHEDRTIIRKYPSGGFIPVDRAYVSEPQTPLLEALFNYLAETFMFRRWFLGREHLDHKKSENGDDQKASANEFR
jgi:hypothetical protein